MNSGEWETNLKSLPRNRPSRSKQVGLLLYICFIFLFNREREEGRGVCGGSERERGLCGEGERGREEGRGIQEREGGKREGGREEGREKRRERGGGEREGGVGEGERERV